MDPKSARALIENTRTQVGDLEFFRITGLMKKERVNAKREKRKDATNQEKALKWSEQQDPDGRCLCGICDDAKDPLEISMRLVRGTPTFPGVVMDHIDPNRSDFNAWDNKQLAHEKCNARKSSKSVPQQAKETGKTYKRIVR